MIAYLGEQLYEGSLEKLESLMSLLEFHWAVRLNAIEGNAYTTDGHRWLPLTTAPEQPIASGQHWYLLGDKNIVYGGYEDSEMWPVVLDLDAKISNIPIQHL